MTLEQLKDELNAIKDPLMAKSQEAMTRVFALYKTLTDKDPRGTGCYGCALDAYYELKTIASRGYGWDNSLNLPKEFTNQFKNIMSNSLKKYKLLRPFRVFGSPDFYNENNLTDALVDKLLKTNPALSKHFEILEKEVKQEVVAQEQDEQQESSIVEDVPVKPRRKRVKK
jgi:hypothetical protein